MGKYVGSWKIDDIIQHKIQTSSVTTGAASDADSVPTWRVYEDGTTTPVTTGSYTTFNAQTGFYNAAITLAAAIGYEKGKNYYIRYSATVASIIGADVDCFQIEAEVDSNSVSVTVNANPVALVAGAITAGTITAGALQGFTVGAVVGAVTVGSTAASAIAGAVTAGSIGPVTIGATAQAAIVDLVWDEPKAGHTTADTYGEYLDATISGISGGSADTTVSPTAQAALVDAIWGATRAAHSTAGTFGEGVASVQGNITGSVASVTNGVTVGATAAAAIAARVTAGSIGAVTVGSTAASAIAAAVTAGSIGPVTLGATAQAAIVDLIWDEPKSGHTTADTYGEFLDSTTSAIKTDTAAIKLQTDTLTFTTSNSIKADIKFVNGVSVTGNGQSGQEWGPGS